MKIRRGVFLFEVVAAAAIIAVVLATMATLATRAVMKRQENWQKLVAHECLATLTDEIGGWSFEQAISENAAALAIPAYAARQLPQASLRAVIKSEPERKEPAELEPSAPTPECRVVYISISWAAGDGRPLSRVRNTIWKFP